MKKLNEIWDFFDEKKTAIGAFLMASGHIMEKFPTTSAIGSVLQEYGSYLAEVGLAHKGYKFAVSKK